MDACDPDAKSTNIRKLIKLHTGRTISISSEKTCELMRDIRKGSLPLPPLVLTRDKKYLLDSKSPLTRKDYETLFKSNVTSKVVKRLAIKVGLTETGKTITDLKRAIGRKLSSMKVREPILLPGSRVYSKIKNEPFINEEMHTQNENRIENENRNREGNRIENENRNREGNRIENENRNREGNQNQSRNQVVNVNSSGKSLRNTLARKRHVDRMKRISGNGTNTRSTNSNTQVNKIKLNTERRLREQKLNFNRRLSEKQIIEERRKRREARIIETKVRNGRRAELNANSRAKKAEAAKNQEYENKMRAQLKSNTNSQRAKSLEKKYANLRNKTKRTLNMYNLNRKRAFSQLRNSQSKVETLSGKLKKEAESVDLERVVSKKLQSDLYTTKLKVQKSEQRIKEIEKERIALNNTVMELQSRLETKTKGGNVNEVEVGRLNKELNEAKTKIEALTKEVTTLTNNTTQMVADATKDFNTKLTQAIKNRNNAITSSASNKKKVALFNAKYKAARSELNSKNIALKKVVNNKAANLETTRMELNRIRSEKEEALAKFASEKNTALKAANNARKALAVGKFQSVTSKILAEQKLKKAQSKIDAANANRVQILTNAKSEREAALAKAQQNKNAALVVASRDAQVELDKVRKEKEDALLLANTERKKAIVMTEEATRAKAAANTQAEKNAAEKKAIEAMRIREKTVADMRAAAEKAKVAREKINATLRAKAQKARDAVQKRKDDKAAANKAAANKAAANKAAANKAAANKAAANKAAANKAAANKAAANKAAANKAAANKAAANKAVANKAAANKAAANKAAANKAVANKAAADAELLKRQRQNVQKRMANAKLASNRKIAENRMTKIAKARKILATYKTTNPFRKSATEKQGEELIQKFQKGDLVQIEPAIAQLVRDMKKKNDDSATEKLITAQTARAAEQFDMRKKKEIENREKARLARIEIQKREGKKVAANRALTRFKLNAKRSKNAMANKKAIDAMKDASNKKVVSNLVSGALTKAIKSGPVTTIYQSSTDANRDKVKNKVDKKVETKGYKAVWDTMIDLDGRDKASLNKIETKLNKKYTLKQGIQELPGAAFKKGRVPGSGVAARTSLLTQVMRPYVGGGDKYDEHKKQYNNAFKVYKNPAFGNTKSSKVNGMVTASNVMISMKRAPIPPPGVKPPNGRFRAIARAQIPPTKPTAVARAAQISMNKRKAVGNPAIARKAYTNQAKFKQNANVRRAAERAAVSAKAYIARNDKFRATGISQIASNKADARRAQLAARKAAKKKLK